MAEIVIDELLIFPECCKAFRTLIKAFKMIILLYESSRKKVFFSF